uniref:Phlebovirus_G2 domain-containing protein n=1 Tax=Strongyloides papillosus TaxID=174720 RepID=A0A0N5C6H9_STREA
MAVTVFSLCKCKDIRNEKIELSLRKPEEVYENRTEECGTPVTLLTGDISRYILLYDIYVNFTHLCKTTSITKTMIVVKECRNIYWDRCIRESKYDCVEP